MITRVEWLAMRLSGWAVTAVSHEEVTTKRSLVNAERSLVTATVAKVAPECERRSTVQPCSWYVSCVKAKPL